jgi:hypothetical protein
MKAKIRKILNAFLTLCAYGILGFMLTLTIFWGVALTQPEILTREWLYGSMLCALTLSPITGVLGFIEFHFLNRLLLPPLYRDESLSKKDVLIISLRYANPIAILCWVFIGVYRGINALVRKFLPWTFVQLANHP